MVDGAALTAPDSILGTAAYLSPEQVRGTRIRPASDVYSLGLVLLEALTGRRAFPGPAAEAAVARLTRPPALPADASPALADLLSRMTALDPSDRPRAAEVAEALRDELAGAITVPDAAHTAEVPRLDVLPAAPPPLPAALPGEDETLPHDRLWTPAAGISLSAASLETGPRPQIVPAVDQRAAPRRRFPTVLAVGASALAAAVAGIIISTSAGLTSSPPDANAVGGDVAKGGVTASAPAASAQNSSRTAIAPLRAAQGGAAVATTPHTASSPRPTPTHSSATPTPSGSASPSPSGTPSGSAGSSPAPTSTATTTPPLTTTPPATDPPTTPPAESTPPPSTEPGSAGSGTGNGATIVSADGASPSATL
jgi:eukaryotic-like serine/threonine-protein kinase